MLETSQAQGHRLLSFSDVSSYLNVLSVGSCYSVGPNKLIAFADTMGITDLH